MLAPQSSVTEGELRRGLRYLLIDASFATAIGALNSGVVLLALALHIGASNVEIGLLAAIPLFTQVLQAPAVTLVERLRARRRISVVCVFFARLALPVYAAVPFIGDQRTAAAVLTVAALLHYGLNAIGACSWNSWMRDLVPSDRLGRFFSRRTMYGTAVSALATVGGALALERASGDRATGDYIFAALYLFGFVCGLVSTAALARVPEPRMPASSESVPIYRLLAAPLRDRNFRSMLRYLASWQFAVNLATPFFTVYFVRELGFSMGFVLVLSFISQMANLAVIRGWGVLSDRFANKSVLGVATPLFILCVAAMAFASEVEGQTLRAAYLVVLHVVMGAAGAGVGLASGNIVLKLSPPSGATGFMDRRLGERLFRDAQAEPRAALDQPIGGKRVRGDVHPPRILFPDLGGDGAVHDVPVGDGPRAGRRGQPRGRRAHPVDGGANARQCLVGGRAAQCDDLPRRRADQAARTAHSVAGQSAARGA
jgi:MFS family permease